MTPILIHGMILGMTVGSLVDYLKTQSEKGVSHVYLSQAARDAVRSAIKVNKVSPKAMVAEVPKGNERPAPGLSERKGIEVKSRTAPVPQVKAQVVPPSSVEIAIPSGDKASQMSALKQQAEHWPPAQSLGTLRQRLVFSSGSLDAELMIVGDAPGFDDEMTKEPFAGKAGHKLNQILKAMTLQRSDLYLTNLCKFRPSSPRQTTNVRKPSEQEIASCLPLLKKEIEIVKPKCILALGATATQALLQQESASIAALRGTWQSFGGIPVLPSFHPVYLLRNANDAVAKRKLWEDMLMVMEFLQIPISEKQRGFFK